MFEFQIQILYKSPTKNTAVAHTEIPSAQSTRGIVIEGNWIPPYKDQNNAAAPSTYLHNAKE